MALRLAPATMPAVNAACGFNQENLDVALALLGFLVHGAWILRAGGR